MSRYPEKVVMTESGPTGELSKSDEKRFNEIVEKIEYVVFNAWREAGPLFQELRDKRLYRKTHKHVEDFCRDKWGISKRRMNQIIHSHKNALLCESKMGTAVPKTVFKSERSARPLKGVPHGSMDEVAKRIEVIADTEEITEQIVRNVVSKVCPVKKKKQPDRIPCEHCGGKGWTLAET